MRNLVRDFYNNDLTTDTLKFKQQFKQQHKAALRKRCFIRRIKFINSWRRVLIQFS